MMQLLSMRTSSNDLRLSARLKLALPTEVEHVSRRLCAQIHDAATRSAAWTTRRRARLLSLLCVDALNPNRPEPSRTLHWRRLIVALAPFARETRSLPLRQLVLENADLLIGGSAIGTTQGGPGAAAHPFLQPSEAPQRPESPGFARTGSHMRNLG